MNKRSLFISLLLLFQTFFLFSQDPAAYRLPYNHPGLVVDLGVGLWANPVPVDWNGDGLNDLLVTCRDKPSKGMYYFENRGDGTFSRGKKIADGLRNLTVSWPGGTLILCTPG